MRQDCFVIVDVHGDDASVGDSHAKLHNIIETFRTREMSVSVPVFQEQTPVVAVFDFAVLELDGILPASCIGQCGVAA